MPKNKKIAKKQTREKQKEVMLKHETQLTQHRRRSSIATTVSDRAFRGHGWDAL